MAMVDTVTTARGRRRQLLAIVTDIMATVVIEDMEAMVDMVDTAMASERLILVTVTRATVVDTAATDMATAIMDKSAQVQEFSA